MAITPEELIAPEGPVEPDLFPGEHTEQDSKLIVRLSGYITQAEVRIATYPFTPEQEDPAARVYALYLAFRAAYTLSLARPAEDDMQTSVLGRTLFTEDQRKGLKEEADRYLGEFDSLAAVAGATSAASSGLPSFQSQNVFDW